jgi:hypothetical protein
VKASNLTLNLCIKMRINQSNRINRRGLIIRRIIKVIKVFLLINFLDRMRNRTRSLARHAQLQSWVWNLTTRSRKTRPTTLLNRSAWRRSSISAIRFLPSITTSTSLANTTDRSTRLRNRASIILLPLLTLRRKNKLIVVSPFLHASQNSRSRIKRVTHLLNRDSTIRTIKLRTRNRENLSQGRISQSSRRAVITMTRTSRCGQLLSER